MRFRIFQVLVLAAALPCLAQLNVQKIPRPQGVIGNANIGFFNKDMAAMTRMSKSQGVILKARYHETYGTPQFLTGALTRPSSLPVSQIASNFIEANRGALSLKTSDQAVVHRILGDKLGGSHVKMRLYRNGLEIWPAEVAVHINNKGQVFAFNGNYRTPQITATKPGIEEKQAIEIALKALAPKVEVDTIATLLIYDWHVNTPMLAWRIEAQAKKVYPLREDIFVNALTGEVINRIDRIYTMKAPVTCTVHPYVNRSTTATVDGYQDGSNILLIHTGKSMFPGQLDPATLAGTIHAFDAQNTNASQAVPFASDPNGDRVFDDNDNVRAAGAAYYWMSNVYDWLLQTFNWNSYDNNGTALKMFVNFREEAGQGLDNAFWSGRELVFGDGGTFFHNLAYGADVAAHELCHAVTDATAQLVYQFQSGALNESFSDVYASLFDNGNWEIGEEIVKPAFGAPALRSMQDPNQGMSQGSNGWQPKDMTQFQNLSAQQDNGGVHVNSGIPNHAFYKLATAIGMADAGQIMHRALSTYLNRNSEFSDLRLAAESSAKDLFGDGSAQMTAVSNAYSEVGIGAAAPTPTTEAVTLYYPLIAPFDRFNDSFSAAFYVTNPSDSAVNVTVAGVDTTGTVTGSLDFSLNGRQTTYFTSDQTDQWALATANGPIIGAYQHLNANGTSWSLIPATPYINNGMYLPHIATNTEKFWTVGGLANVVDTPSSVVYVDNASEDGITFNINSIGESTIFDFEELYDQVLGGLPNTSQTGGLWGLFLNFDLEKTEVLDFNLVGAEIFGRKDVSQSAGLQMDATSGRTIYFTHVAANANFWTGYSLVNISDPSLGNVPVRIICYDSTGKEVANSVVELAPFGKLLRVTGDETVPLGTSWFLASAQKEGASLTGMELFGSVDDQQMAGFQALPYTARKFAFPFVIIGDQNRPTMFSGMPTNYTGISVINPNPVAVNLKVTFYDSNGNGTVATGPLGPNQKLLDLLSNIFTSAQGYGYIEIESDRPVAGFSLSGFTTQQEWAANPMIVLE